MNYASSCGKFSEDGMKLVLQTVASQTLYSEFICCRLSPQLLVTPQQNVAVAPLQHLLSSQTILLHVHYQQPNISVYHCAHKVPSPHIIQQHPFSMTSFLTCWLHLYPSPSGYFPSAFMYRNVFKILSISILILCLQIFYPVFLINLT